MPQLGLSQSVRQLGLSQIVRQLGLSHSVRQLGLNDSVRQFLQNNNPKAECCTFKLNATCFLLFTNKSFES